MQYKIWLAIPYQLDVPMHKVKKLKEVIIDKTKTYANMFIAYY